MNHTNQPRNTNEEQPQPQQTPNTKTRTENNDRKTTENNTGVRNSEPPNKPKKQPNTIIVRKSEF
jgi:SET domain-containing protein